MLGIRVSIIGLLAAWLAGCVAGKPGIPFDHSQASDVKSIAILSPGLPDGPAVVLASSVGQSFGIVGALVDAGLKASRDATFKSVMDQQGFSPRTELSDSLVQHLQERGYRVTAVPVERPKLDFAKNYPNDPSVDAYLDVVVLNYGYVAAGIHNSTPYRPMVLLVARLIRASNAAVLMEETVVFNPVNSAGYAVTVAPDPDYQFKDFDTLVAAPEKAITGLRLAIDRSAETIGTLLQ